MQEGRPHWPQLVFGSNLRMLSTETLLCILRLGVISSRREDMSFKKLNNDFRKALA
jgi:hypothetical protein